MPPKLSDEQVAELARQQAQVDVTDEQVMQMAQQAATQDVLGQGPPQAGAEGPGAFDQYVKPAILPTGMGMAGQAIGNRFGGPIGGAVGSGIGSGVGEGINQLTGITEPSLTNLATATGLPMAIGAAGQGISALRRIASPQMLNANAAEEAAAAVGKMSSRVSASSLFQMATQAQVKVPMNRTVHAIDNMLDELTNVSTGVQKSNSQVIGYLKGLKNLLGTSPDGLSPQALQRELEGAGNVIKSVNTKGGTGSGSIKQVFKHMVGDLDDAAKTANPGQLPARALVAARDTFKRESVLKEVGEEIDAATRQMRGQGGDIQFNGAAVLNAIKKNDFYKSALTEQERTGLESMLKMLNKIPPLPPPGGQPFGSGQYGRMAASGAAGATAGAGMGFAAGGPVGAGIGGALGLGAAAVPPAVEFGKNVATALSMETGRALYKELLTQSKGVATPQVMSILSAYAQAVRAGQVQE